MQIQFIVIIAMPNSLVTASRDGIISLVKLGFGRIDFLHFSGQFDPEYSLSLSKSQRCK